jgi:hypothetical protein
MQGKLLFLILFFISGLAAQAQEVKSDSSTMGKTVTEDMNGAGADKHIKICTGMETTTIDLDSEEVGITGEARLYVYDLLGNVIFSKWCNFNENDCYELQLKNPGKGVYFIHITNGKENLTHKIILE